MAKVRPLSLPLASARAVPTRLCRELSLSAGGAPAAWPRLSRWLPQRLLRVTEASPLVRPWVLASRPARVHSMSLTVRSPVLRRPRPGPPERGAAVCRVEGPHRHEDGDHHRGRSVQGVSVVSVRPRRRGSDPQPPRRRRRTGWYWVLTLGAPTGTRWPTRTARRSTT